MVPFFVSYPQIFRAVVRARFFANRLLFIASDLKIGIILIW